MENLFNVLPTEIINLIFLSLPSVREICTLAQTCRYFYRYSKSKHIWKARAIEWWERKCYNKKITLEEVMKAVQIDFPDIDYHWFCRCFYFEGNEKGIGCMETDKKTIAIGNFMNKSLNGWGIEISLGEDLPFTFGSFINGSLNGNGECIWKSGHHYKGSFIDGWREGQGIYWFPEGTSYSGGIV